MNDATGMADQATYDRAVQHFGQRHIALPTFAELAEPQRIGAARVEGLKSVDADAAEGLNLFRVHWYNDATRTGLARLPAHVVLPEALTGVASPIIVVAGRPLPDDPRPQGAAGLCLPGVAPGDRPLRPGAPPRAVAFHRQLLPRRRGHLAHRGLPRRCHPARGHERRALPLAREVGHLARGHRAHAGHRKQRARDLRSLRARWRRTRPTWCSTSSASSPITWRTTASPGAPSSTCSARCRRRGRA